MSLIPSGGQRFVLQRRPWEELVLNSLSAEAETLGWARGQQVTTVSWGLVGFLRSHPCVNVVRVDAVLWSRVPGDLSI